MLVPKQPLQHGAHAPKPVLSEERAKVRLSCPFRPGEISAGKNFPGPKKSNKTLFQCRVSKYHRGRKRFWPNLPPPQVCQSGISLTNPAFEENSKTLGDFLSLPMNRTPVNQNPMNQNRRRHARKVPDQFGFVQIEGDELGRVLNLSEGGLSFSSFTPISQNGPLYFWFSFNLKDRIEAMGEVVWTDPSRKIGGLRFTHLPNTSRRQILAWLSLLPAQPISREEALPQMVAAGEPARKRAGEPDRVAKFVSKARAKTFPAAVGTAERAEAIAPPRHLPRPLSPSDREAPKASPPSPRPQPLPPPVKIPTRDERSLPSIPLPASPKPLFQQTYTLNLNRPEEVPKPAPVPLIDASGGLVPVQRYYSAKKRQLVLGVVLGVGLSAGVAWAAYKYSKYLRTETAAPRAAAESSLAKNETPATPAPRQPESVPKTPPMDIFSGSDSMRAVVPKSASNKPASTAKVHAQSRPLTLEAKAPNPSARAIGQPPVSSVPAADKKPATFRQLWSAVQAGNSNAAVELAEHYIQGDGVPQNCQQARVLLLMASEKRNPAAIKRLQQLDKDKTACP